MENWCEIDTMMSGYSLDDYLEVDNVTDAVNKFMMHFENPYLDGSKRIVFARNIEDWYKSI